VEQHVSELMANFMLMKHINVDADNDGVFED